jgi:hypothetical protein
MRLLLCGLLTNSNPRAQVDLAGDTMVACSMASTGEALTFGGSGGYVHLWALSHQPRINSYSEVCELSCTAIGLQCGSPSKALPPLVPPAASGGAPGAAAACGAADGT